MRTCNVQSNKNACNCTYSSCSRHGVCCECMVYHRRMGELPACYFPNDIEKTYDRSVETFIRVYQERKHL
ncbi:MAG: hypothetical protein JXB48_08405 [Candidatus Latescibacteria bacterium]|nr:hypothetical protein [Candidatus Latescibacterota bacterium]